ncbi:uncharacterized protein [Elaeis guineensis]|uniref:uncharacterized protein isoform X2 n=1 Tax=Elaeis guineensis var. tenera TaxID=51953 RepID=UPI003C6D52E6
MDLEPSNPPPASFVDRIVNFLVDIKGPTLAHLPVRAFEGGTRRNISKFEVNASSPATVIVVSNAIMNSEFLSGTQQRIMVEKLMQKLQ